jgi:hypothetical protein
MELSSHLHAFATLPLGKSPWYPFSRRLCGPHSQWTYFGEVGSLLPKLGIKPWFIGPLACNQVCLFYVSCVSYERFQLQQVTKNRVPHFTSNLIQVFILYYSSPCIKLMFGKFKTDQMHNFQVVLFILFYFSSKMLRWAAVLQRNTSVLLYKTLKICYACYS